MKALTRVLLFVVVMVLLNLAWAPLCQFVVSAQIEDPQSREELAEPRSLSLPRVSCPGYPMPVYVPPADVDFKIQVYVPDPSIDHAALIIPDGCHEPDSVLKRLEEHGADREMLEERLGQWWRRRDLESQQPKPEEAGEPEEPREPEELKY